MGSVKAVNLCSCCWEQWEHLCSGLSLPSCRGRCHGQCPHTLPQIPFLQELQRESIYTYRKEMVFLKFTYDTCLLKYICSGLRVECSGLCLFLLCGLLPSSLSSSLTSFSSHHASGRANHVLERPLDHWWFSMHSLSHRSSELLRASPKAMGTGCGLGAADPQLWFIELVNI